MIKSGKAQDSRHIQLEPGTETVNLDAAMTDSVRFPADAAGEQALWRMNNLARHNGSGELVIDGGGRALQLGGRGKGSLLTVGEGVSLTLRNIVLTGSSNNDSALVKVEAGGALVLGRGAVVKENRNFAVHVEGGLCVMSGGEISGNGREHYGVLVSGGGAFTLDGGTLRGNVGGVVLESGAFTLEEGELSDNISAVILEGGEFYMNGGTIRGSTSPGVYLGSGTFCMNGGEISGNYDETNAGDGPYVSGGGVYVVGGKFIMNGGAIRENYAYTWGNGRGGGVYVGTGGRFYMNGGTIEGNTIKGEPWFAWADGGGVYVDSNGAFHMSGGAISGNTALGREFASGSKGGGCGGGVYIKGGGVFAKTGGVIYGLDAPDGLQNRLPQNAAGDGGCAVCMDLGDRQKIRDQTAGTAINLNGTDDAGWEIVDKTEGRAENKE
jgi:hypothetical protein